MGILLRTSFLEIDKMPFEGIVQLYKETKSLTSLTKRNSEAIRFGLDEIVMKLQGKS